MADITFAFVPADGDVLDADALAAAIYQRQHVDDTLAAYNGSLQKSNLDAAFGLVQPEHVRVGTWTDGRMSAATANYDYRNDPWMTAADITTPSGDVGYEQRLVAVVGAAHSWQNRAAPLGLVFWWHISAIADTANAVDSSNTYTTGSSDAQDYNYRMALYINGQRVPAFDYKFKEGTTTMVEAGDPAAPLGLMDNTKPDQRTYTAWLLFDGDAYTQSGLDSGNNPLTRGWHSAAICVGGEGQVRVRVRRFGVIPLY